MAAPAQVGRHIWITSYLIEFDRIRGCKFQARPL